MTEDGEPLTGEDAHILGLESATITGHTLKLIVLEPGGRPLDVDRLRESVAARLAGQPRATERVEVGEDGPRWVNDAAFDITAHVRRHGESDGVSWTRSCSTRGRARRRRRRGCAPPPHRRG